jgi:hypothetical protein
MNWQNFFLTLTTTSLIGKRSVTTALIPAVTRELNEDYQ